MNLSKEDAVFGGFIAGMGLMGLIGMAANAAGEPSTNVAPAGVFLLLLGTGAMMLYADEETYA